MESVRKRETRVRTPDCVDQKKCEKGFTFCVFLSLFYRMAFQIGLGDKGLTDCDGGVVGEKELRPFYQNS